MSQLLLDITPENEPTLDNFIVGRNSELVSVLRHALAGDTSERCFYLWGESGSGKSHLLKACISEAQLNNRKAIYAEGEIARDIDAEIVAVDDVERLDDEEQIALFDLYNQMKESGGMLLVSGKEAALNLELRDDLRTRLGWGLVYQVQGLTDEEKAIALAQHAKSKGYQLSHEVLQYLLRHGRRDLPSLLSVLDKLDVYSLRLHRPPTVPLLKEILNQN